MKFQFLNLGHEKDFAQYREEKMSGLTSTDKTFLSIAFLINVDPELCAKVTPYLELEKGAFAFEEMFKNVHFTQEHETLARFAVSLYSEDKAVNLVNLVNTLSDAMLDVAVNALIIRKYGIQTRYNEIEEKLLM